MDEFSRRHPSDTLAMVWDLMTLEKTLEKACLAGWLMDPGVNPGHDIGPIEARRLISDTRLVRTPSSTKDASYDSGCFGVGGETGISRECAEKHSQWLCRNRKVGLGLSPYPGEGRRKISFRQ